MIYYESHGVGPAVLCFAPGGMRSAAGLWSRAPWHPVNTLSDQFRVITMDQRNAGASRAAISASDGWDSYTDDHLALLDELDIDHCRLLGGCIGGAFALALALRAPDRVNAAVLQQPIGFDGTNRALFYELFDAWGRDLEQQRAEVDAQALGAFRERMFGGDFVFSATRERASGCQTPLLVLMGNDAYHPAPVSEDIARIAPKAELVREWKTGEDLALAVARVRAFLSEH